MNKFFFTVKIGQNYIGPINVNPSLGDPTQAQPSFAFNGVEGGFLMKANGEHGITLRNTQKDSVKSVTVTLTFIDTEDATKNWEQKFTCDITYGLKHTFRSAVSK
jgi:hypothetical protein